MNSIFGKLLLAAGGGTAFVGAQKYWRENRVVQAKAENEEARAIAVLRGEPGYNIHEDTKIYVELYGLDVGKHGFHIHEYGNLSQGCTSAGGHYNPFNKNHGGPLDRERHVGDLGNLEQKDPPSPTNPLRVSFTDPMVKIYGPTGVIGRSVVVHRDEDDLGRGGHPDSKTTGHSGPRIACGVIGADA